VFAELLRERLGSLIQVSTTQIDQMETHFELLNRWNKVLSLTSIWKPDEIVELHYCESLFLATRLPPSALRIVDLGSGAGFPGIPIAIARHDCFLTLIESHQRKSVFLREATRKLPNICIVASRGEDVSDRFDWATSRAVKFETIENTMAKLAPNVAVLAGEDLPGTRFTWNTPIQLPWGRQRYLWIGVSRETAC
jgi:16S rRNA (guanine(527)-N(7))-methyltransferase RsmG